MSKVLVAMSGGVDSSVTAAYLKEQGYDVIGLTFIMFSEDDQLNSADKQAVDDAKDVANNLGIKHYVYNISKEFKESIINDFINQYEQAKTPNPCVICNRRIKFNFLLKKADELNADYIATGHYAVIEKNNERYRLKKALDSNKDQSYMLYRMSQKQLKRSIFPLGKFTKEKIRYMAKEYGLIIHDKPDSQDICFIQGNNYIKFLERQNIKDTKGPILDLEGNKLGEHDGLYKYTIGQRRGLGISKPYPLYVIKLDKKTNAVIVGKNTEVYSNTFFCKNLNWIYFDKLIEPLIVDCKIRYNSPAELATIYPEKNDVIKVVFKDEQRAITPGQSAVFYLNEDVVGGGIIE